MKLSNFHINSYNDNGFLVIKKFFSKKDIETISSELNKILSADNKNIYLYYTRSKINKKLILNRIENFFWDLIVLLHIYYLILNNVF